MLFCLTAVCHHRRHTATRVGFNLRETYFPSSVYLPLFLAWMKIQSEESVILFLVVWTLTEITRYSYYTFSLLHHLPYFIKWARWGSRYPRQRWAGSGIAVSDFCDCMLLLIRWLYLWHASHPRPRPVLHQEVMQPFSVLSIARL